MNANDFLSFNQVLSVIAAVGHRRTVLVQGENGVGKTALHGALKRHPKFQNHIFVPPIDMTQASDGTFWMPSLDLEKGVSRELPNERFGMARLNQRGINGARPVVICFDEILKAPEYIKKAASQYIYERMAGEYGFPDGSVLFCASNLALEGLGDSLQAHLRNRLLPIKMRKATMEEWLRDFAIPAGLHEVLIAFCHEYPHVFDSFLDYEKGGKYEGKNLSMDNPLIFNPKAVQDAYASLRSLHTASDVLTDCEANGVDDHSLDVTLKAAVGAPTAAALASYVRFGRDLCSYERVINDPDKAPITDNPAGQLVQVFKLITRCGGRDEAAAITKYVERIRPEMQSVFATQVAQSTKVSTFVTIAEFGALMAKHRIYL